MERFAPEPSRTAISAAILDAPGWARIGITMPNDRLRAEAAEELARVIVDRLHHTEPSLDMNQLTLPI
ncbi:DUF6771 family protein [Sphingomonas koreensis]|uniref:DUF6771 family protein n=1 Tax=Sphingomonas koreensis TaxID=93064 RepID=UPI00234EB171|nr:DUF6771 family protein [Sphingomonas koreensis]MDC7810106.1 hypothetical protein [Sphingomonas koreensis]